MKKNGLYYGRQGTNGGCETMSFVGFVVIDGLVATMVNNEPVVLFKRLGETMALSFVGFVVMDQPCLFPCYIVLFRAHMLELYFELTFNLKLIITNGISFYVGIVIYLIIII